MANVGIAPSSQDLEFRCADAAMTKDLRAARYKSQQTAAPLIPRRPTVASFRVAAASCKACDLWERARQTVFGVGDAHARVVIVGEQIGDSVELAGIVVE